MAISYPPNCDSPRKRTEYLYRAQELLRLIHNAFAKWHRTGLTQNQYNKLPNKIKNKYPYKAKLTDSDMKGFYDDVFMPISSKICNQIGIQRALLFESVEWTPAVEDM